MNDDALHRRRKRRARLLRLHRLLGVVVALYLLLFSVSGILINHSHRLGLDASPLQSRWLLSLYGVDLPPVTTGFRVGDHWVTAVGDQAYFDATSLGRCEIPVRAVAGSYGETDGAGNAEWLLVQCADSVMLLTSTGELVERLPLPEAVTGLAWHEGQFVAKGQMQLWRFDPVQSQWSVLATPSVAWPWIEPQALPDPLRVTLEPFNAVPDLTWERFLLDLHSGSLWGEAGVVVADLAALALMVLALSGFWAWFGRHKRG